jgi:hypothetical protein
MKKQSHKLWKLTAGAESYPNGTVILSEPLNPGHGDVM